MLKIVIPDPGLREYSGHHPAMISSIANSKEVVSGAIELDVFCNVSCPESFIDKIQSPHVTFKKHFSTDFYKFFYEDFNLSALNQYINQLTREYLHVFKRYSGKLKLGGTKQALTEKTRKEDVLFLYHTLNWEHAAALGAAIAMYNEHYTLPQKHCVFLMFNPINYHKNHQLVNQLNHQRYLNFKVGFSLLQKQKNVRFYAGEYELQQHYKKLLQQYIQNDTIPIHPCGLLSQNLNENKEQEKKRIKDKSIILFTGDAKKNKGFLELPMLAKHLTQQITNKDVVFIIQYTVINNNAEAFKRVNNELLLLSRNDHRIKITRRFWSHQELHHNFAKAKIILFNYDSTIYQNQSSGVLWLAALYRLKMVFLTTGWLVREAERLGCDYKISTRRNLMINTRKYLMQKQEYFDKVNLRNDSNNDRDVSSSDIVPPYKSECYRNELFRDIGPWLLLLAKEKF